MVWKISRYIIIMTSDYCHVIQMKVDTTCYAICYFIFKVLGYSGKHINILFYTKEGIFTTWYYSEGNIPKKGNPKNRCSNNSYNIRLKHFYFMFSRFCMRNVHGAVHDQLMQWHENIHRGKVFRDNQRKGDTQNRSERGLFWIGITRFREYVCLKNYITTKSNFWYWSV